MLSPSPAIIFCRLWSALFWTPHYVAFHLSLASCHSFENCCSLLALSSVRSIFQQPVPRYVSVISPLKNPDFASSPGRPMLPANTDFPARLLHCARKTKVSCSGFSPSFIQNDPTPRYRALTEYGGSRQLRGGVPELILHTAIVDSLVRRHRYLKITRRHLNRMALPGA